MLAILGWIVFGLIVGAIARLLVPGSQKIGLLLTMALGVVGSLLGGFVGWLLSGTPRGGYDPAGWILSVVGAVVVLWGYISFRSRPGARSY